MNRYRVRVIGQGFRKTINADYFSEDGNNITFYNTIRRNGASYDTYEKIRFISNVAEIELIEDSKDNNSDN